MNQTIRMGRPLSPIGRSISLAGGRLGNPDVLLPDQVAQGYQQSVLALLEAIGALGNPSSLASHRAKLQSLSSKLQTSPAYVPDDFTSTIQNASTAISAENARQAGQSQTNVLLPAAQAQGVYANVVTLLQAIGTLGNPSSLELHRAKLQFLSARLQASPAYVPDDFGVTIQNASAAISAENAKRAGGGAPEAGPSTVAVVGVIGVVALGLWLAL